VTWACNFVVEFLISLQMFLGIQKRREDVVEEELLQGEDDAAEVSTPHYMCFLFVLHSS
jgi:hypothetical protein